MNDPGEPFVAVVDADMGNPGSCLNMLRKIGAEAVLTQDPRVIARAARLILPGVGAFDEGMRNLRRRALVEPLKEAVFARKVPLLGICLGMQLLGQGSEEGGEAGLGWLPFRCVNLRTIFDAGSTLKVPHMGWNTIEIKHQHSLLSGCDDHFRFYFVHSFACPIDIGDACLATTHYGVDFTSVVGDANILGVQFHPEKSHNFGMRLLANFSGKEL